MITNRTRDRIVELALKRIVDPLSEKARQEVIEHFCLSHCGRLPERGFCPAADSVYKTFLSELYKVRSECN